MKRIIEFGISTELAYDDTWWTLVTIERERNSPQHFPYIRHYEDVTKTSLLRLQRAQVELLKRTGG